MFNASVDFKPVKRFDNKRDMTGFKGFNNNMSKGQIFFENLGDGTWYSGFSESASE